MIQIKLDALFRRQAEEVKRGSIARLAAGLDVKGKPLAPKARDDGRPLGGSRVPAEIAVASVRTRPDGWSISVAGIRSTQFHHGDRDQPARKAVGMTRPQRDKFQREAEAEIAKQITAQLARGAR